MWITPLDFRKVWISGARRKDGGKMYALTNLFFAAAIDDNDLTHPSSCVKLTM